MNSKIEFCSQHSGMEARLKALENSDRDQWTAIGTHRTVLISTLVSSILCLMGIIGTLVVLIK